MAKKKLKGTMTVTFKVEQTDGDTPETLDALAEWGYMEWEGLEVYFQDPEQEDETVVKLSPEKIEITTD